MRTFGKNTTAINLDFPNTWDPSAISEITLGIIDTDGNEIQAATAIGLYTPTTTGDSERYDDSVVLAVGSSPLDICSRVLLDGIEGTEEHTVKSYDLATRTVTFEQTLDRDFPDGSDVYRLSGVATVDLSEVDAGTQIVLTWTPDVGNQFVERAEIETISLDYAGISQYLQDIYARAYDALIKPADRLDRVIQTAIGIVRKDLAKRNIDIARVVDQADLTPLVAAQVAYLWTVNGDKNTEDERAFYGKRYSNQVSEFCSLPIWQDADGDGIEDDGEVATYSFPFENQW